MKIVNRFNRADTRRLEDWIAAKWDTIGKLSAADAANVATIEFGFTVLKSNVRSAAKILGRQFPKATRKDSGRKRTPHQRPPSFRLYQVAQSIERLRKALGELPDMDMASIMDDYEKAHKPAQ